MAKSDPRRGTIFRLRPAVVRAGGPSDNRVFVRCQNRRIHQHLELIPPVHPSKRMEVVKSGPKQGRNLLADISNRSCRQVHRDEKRHIMAWTTGQVTQNGNTTRGWVISGSALSTHDAIVVRPTSGSSGVRLESVTARLSPTRYSVTTRVIGSGAMAFRFAAEQMD